MSLSRCPPNRQQAKTLESRLKSFGDRGGSFQILSEAAYLSEAAQSEFLDKVEAAPLCLSPAGLRTLAIIRPSSTLLRNCCLEALGKGQHHNQQVSIDAEVAQILAEAMPDDPHVLETLVARAQSRDDPSSILALGIYAPAHPSLETILPRVHELMHGFGRWSAAAQVIGPFAPVDEFIRFIVALITRDGFYARFDAQSFANRAIEARLRHDDSAAERMMQEIHRDAHPSVLATFPRLLASAGRMTAALRERIIHLLAIHAGEQIVPLAGYDAVSDGIRSVRTSMFDALHYGAEV